MQAILSEIGASQISSNALSTSSISLLSFYPTLLNPFSFFGWFSAIMCFCSILSMVRRIETCWEVLMAALELLEISKPVIQFHFFTFLHRQRLDCHATNCSGPSNIECQIKQPQPMGKFRLESISSENAPSTCFQECGSSNYTILEKLPCYYQQPIQDFKVTVRYSQFMGRRSPCIPLLVHSLTLHEKWSA